MKVIDQIKKHVITIMDNDPAHDFEHVMRVYNNAQKIAKKEKANQKLVLLLPYYMILSHILNLVNVLNFHL